MKTEIKVTVEHEGDNWTLLREMQAKMMEIPGVNDCALQLMIAIP